MRLQLISDLHTELQDMPFSFSKEIEIAPNLDFLVIAGDLFAPARQDAHNVEAIIDYFAEKARHILFVWGNHEYYGSDFFHTESFKVKFPTNWHVLYNSDLTLDGVHFFGGTMWFPDNPDGLNMSFAGFMNDFHQISKLTSWVYAVNKQFRDEAARLLRPESIVITHHLPSDKSTPAMYKGSHLNRFFVNDHERLIALREPRLWLHGHTHQPCDYVLGKTRVVCNPLGYPNERQPEDYPPVVLEV